MMNEANDSPLFRNMVEALEEGVQWARGDQELLVTVLEAPEENPSEQTQVREYAVLFVPGEEGREAIVPDLPGYEAIGDLLVEAGKLIRYFIKIRLQTLHMHGQPVPQAKTRVEQNGVAA